MLKPYAVPQDQSFSKDGCPYSNALRVLQTIEPDLLVKIVDMLDLRTSAVLAVADPKLALQLSERLTALAGRFGAKNKCHFIKDFNHCSRVSKPQKILISNLDYIPKGMCFTRSTILRPLNWLLIWGKGVGKSSLVFIPSPKPNTHIPPVSSLPLQSMAISTLDCQPASSTENEAIVMLRCDGLVEYIAYFDDDLLCESVYPSAPNRVGEPLALFYTKNRSWVSIEAMTIHRWDGEPLKETTLRGGWLDALVGVIGHQGALWTINQSGSLVFYAGVNQLIENKAGWAHQLSPLISGQPGLIWAHNNKGQLLVLMQQNALLFFDRHGFLLKWAIPPEIGVIRSLTFIKRQTLAIGEDNGYVSLLNWIVGKVTHRINLGDSSSSNEAVTALTTNGNNLLLVAQECGKLSRIKIT